MKAFDSMASIDDTLSDHDHHHCNHGEHDTRIETGHAKIHEQTDIDTLTPQLKINQGYEIST